MSKQQDFTVTETAQGNRYTGDCFDVLPTLPPNRYDLLLTDPPYAMPVNHHGCLVADRRWSDTSIMTFWFRSFMDKVIPVLKPAAPVFVFCDSIAYAVFFPGMYERYRMVKSLVWDKISWSRRLRRPRTGTSWSRLSATP